MRLLEPAALFQKLPEIVVAGREPRFRLDGGEICRFCFVQATKTLKRSAQCHVGLAVTWPERDRGLERAKRVCVTSHDAEHDAQVVVRHLRFRVETDRSLEAFDGL